ncbi:hypothetical protein P7C71_g3242, partial [Lecanoromycetidae sp. Uapishka_2]
MSNDDAFAKFAAHESGDTLPFYEIEGQILALWDQLNELKLEQSLLEARVTSREQPVNDESIDAQLQQAEIECLEARAAYMLRQSIVEDVLIADPILKAVHSGANATTTERTLHPLIDRRDILAIAHTNLSSILQSVSRDTITAETENLRTLEQNRELTTTLLALTKEVQGRETSALANSSPSAQIERVREETVTARKRWRIMKSVVATIIAGSGVDWTRNATLRDLVLDSEDEMD